MIQRINIRLTVVFSMLFISVAALQNSFAKDFDDRVIKHIEYPNWFIDSPFFDLSENIKQASANGKKGLMVVFGTEGCSYCDRFIQKSLHDPIISSAVRKNFDSISLEIFDDVDMVDPMGQSMPVKQFAKQQGVQFSPSIIFYDTHGKRILKLVGYQSPTRFEDVLHFLIKEHYKKVSFRDYLAKEKNSRNKRVGNVRLNSDKLFSRAPHILDSKIQKSNKPILVIFEKKRCYECDVFHSEVLALKDVRDRMKFFKIVRLDIDDTRSAILAPDGLRLTAAQWYKGTGFSRTPALLFFNNTGKKVLETDALVRRLRMINSMNYVLDGAYKKGWTFQRYGRDIGRKKARRENAKQAKTLSESL